MNQNVRKEIWIPTPSFGLIYMYPQFLITDEADSSLHPEGGFLMGYFSFQKMITPIFVKTIHFLGLVLLTAGGIGMAVWAGLRLNEASIAREAGWRYVIIGAGAATVGNLVWRVFCEFWLVLFSINDHLAAANATEVTTVKSRSILVPETEREEMSSHLKAPESIRKEKDRYASRPASVLGLS